MDGFLKTLSEWLPQLLSGLRLSGELTLVVLLVGIPLGLLLSLGSSSRIFAVKAVSITAVEFGRGTPLLVLLQFVYFGLPSGGIPIGAFASAVVAMGWNMGSYSSEVFTSALKAVHRGQREAAMAVGLNSFDTLVHVILPQAMKVAIPPLLGLSIFAFQLTSLCFTISLPELLSKAYNIGSNTFLYFQALVIAGVMYAIFSIPAAWFTGVLEARFSR